MFGLFKRKKTADISGLTYEWVGVDMHSHILPGIDDGAQTPEESIVLIKEMMDVGIRKFIATPHIMADYYRNTRESINDALAVLRDALEKEGIDVPVEAAAEHFFDETFEARVDNDDLMLIKNKYVLFEVSFISKPPNILEVVKKIMAKGYTPILAHPERYTYMSFDEIRGLKFYGCMLQLNTISLTGYYGKQAKTMAEMLVDEGLLDFISSDMHHPRHAMAFKDVLRFPYLTKLKEQAVLKNMNLM
ncbi:tyrosine-protein phosphatase [Hufsiella ginkgonis]|uniref:protein-tyrosine-phosphatase n=1 Tax=Hufsiella ginkgonis TaxID=2695274 RepID=A0A7K1Y2D2_9SPHI|nr:CpsB/CapC family capsule biosynthesis tyrosine phosphatase [Hufsiella ginkgonis]MXV17401.1 capsular biosynthesis protein [Hufsiella ginkgonis]